MNKNDSFSTPEILDVTEVEKVKIQQAGETRRKEILEKEITERQRLSDVRARWTDDGFLTVFGLVGVVFLVCAMSSSIFYSCRKYPEAAAAPPDESKKCVESIQVVRQIDAKGSCPVGATLETKPANDKGDIELRCVCSKK